MKHVLKMTVHVCLFACLLTGTQTLAQGQDSSAPPAADNTLLQCCLVPRRVPKGRLQFAASRKGEMGRCQTIQRMPT